MVRTFRTYYDHFRIAFPHLVSIPKYYDEEWGNEFRVHARQFVRTENMRAVKQVFDSAGYGTERWDKLISLSPEDLTGRFDQIIALNGFAKGEREALDEEKPGEGDARIARAQAMLGKDLWNLLLDSPESFVELLDDASAVDAATTPQAEPETVSQEQDVAAAQPVVEEEAPPETVAGETDELSSEEVDAKPDEALTRLIGVVGSDRWSEILADPDILVRALDGTSEPDAASETAKDSDQGEDEHLKALEAIRSERSDIEGKLADVEAALAEAKKASEALNNQLEDKGREHTATQKKLASVEEKLKETEANLQAQKSKVPDKPVAIPPTKAAQQIQEYEEQLQTVEARLGELEAKSETDDVRLKELTADLKREKHLREKFEEDLEAAREALKEQMVRLRAVLQEEEEIPAIDEFEEMSGDELMEYIGDVEKEKQKVMAGLEALDVQEDSYQKQIEAQNEQLGAIQEDLGKMKESNLAMEVEEARETLEKQRSQLNMLMNYSKNLKSRNEQLVERQEPLRALVQKLNLQEKALVRFIRMNYDSKFMPENALV